MNNFTVHADRPDPEGMHFESTPGHGYMIVSQKRLQEMPPVLLRHTTFYKGGSSFEEDCEWTRVALAFPQYFTGEEQEHAQANFARYHPEIFEAWVKQGKPTSLDMVPE